VAAKTAPCGYTVFDTCLGSCVIGWRGRTITGIQLPESGPKATIVKFRSRIGEVAEASPPQWVKKIINQINQYLRGNLPDFHEVKMALDKLTPFTRKVYQTARRIGYGKIITYGQLASLLGSPQAARAVGNALAQNPFPLVVPCHRVIAANGRPGGFSAFGGIKTKARLLNIEGVDLKWSKAQLSEKKRRSAGNP
jgi:methylated-DNA-[protein]-cysteine S-methyltransferase